MTKALNNKNLPIVAIVGEPNVGKSTLVNKIAGFHTAITSAVAGTTRDRQYTDTTWNGVEFTMVDTAGLTYGGQQELEQELSLQIDVALEEADVILFVADSKLSPGLIDRKVLLKFRKSKKPVILAVNKVDSPKGFETSAAEFNKLGIKSIWPVSAITGRGMGDLMDELASTVKKVKPSQFYTKPQGISVSIIGKPNVGKSSLINNILGQDRMVVSDIPGTTRTSIDIHLKINGEDITLIDTAGLKKKSYRQKQPYVFSVFQTYKSIRRSEVVMLMIDAAELITKQDQVVAGEILDQGKGCIILVNKMDKFEGDEEQLKDYVSLHFPFLWFAPIFFVSAKTGDGIMDALNAIKPIEEARQKKVSQEDLDQLLKHTIKKNGPKRLRDQKVPKVYGLEQLDITPPTFQLTVNHPAAISQQYKKYLQKN